jgi:hypothetical protein
VGCGGVFERRGREGFAEDAKKYKKENTKLNSFDFVKMPF